MTRTCTVCGTAGASLDCAWCGELLCLADQCLIVLQDAETGHDEGVCRPCYDQAWREGWICEEVPHAD